MFARPKKLLFILIVIGLLTNGSGCGESRPIDPGQDASADTDSDTDSDADTDTDSDTDSDTETDTDTGPCNEMEGEEVYTVPSPEPGVPPNPEDLCAVAAPVATSNLAATVALEPTAWDPPAADGQIAIAAELVGRIVGLPAIAVTEAVPAELVDAVVSDVAAAGDGFSFHIEFPSSAWIEPGDTELVVTVTVEVDCDDSSEETQMVESTTYLHLCDGVDQAVWVASGGECTVCSEVCEKIAFPLPASRGPGPAALSGSPQAEIVPVAVHGRSVALFVDHRGTEGPLSYSWKTSAGTLSGSDQAGVIWDLPIEPGPHLVQVAVKDASSATVAILRWRHRA